MPVLRYSSRRQHLDSSFLTRHLTNAEKYDRIAGYFSSSILEVAGEAIETMSGTVRVICNSELQVRDVNTARAANYALRQEWCAYQPERFAGADKLRFSRLYEFLRSGKLIVRVLPRDKFGLVHGKAGVITKHDGGKTAFIGSANETYDAWRLNYELIWEDDSPEAISWTQDEFDALWNHPCAVPLCDFVIEDVGRLAQRTVIPSVADWQANPDPVSPLIELPVFRKDNGLWPHQKYFVDLAFSAHQNRNGARFVLADMVGLGKTIQLGMCALLMALASDKPILVLAPKPLVWQWQDELINLLDLPSAVWTNKGWIDEHGIEHPVMGPEGIRKCPRRVGIVSQGLITSRSEAAGFLSNIQYECVIVDEAHRARRRNLGVGREAERPDPNNLLAFLLELSPLTKSLLLATATPVQMFPVEAWDLLSILSVDSDSVLGNTWSHWRRPQDALNLVMDRIKLPEDDMQAWDWIRNPLPPAEESLDFKILRTRLKLDDTSAVAPGESWQKLHEPDKARVRRLTRSFAQIHNPFIRHIVRRTREYLENTLDPDTGEPYLKPVRVELFGEADNEAILLPQYLSDAYKIAEDFCRLLGQRVKGSGFLKTLLLRRVGSTIYAGKCTATNMLNNWEEIESDDDDEEEIIAPNQQFRALTPHERSLLQDFVNALEANQERDPKYRTVVELLVSESWLEMGCIIFSQYFDSVWWLGTQLSVELPEEVIGLYAGGSKSGVFSGGVFIPKDREELKRLVRTGSIRLLLGTDAASEGLNLQKLGTLINLDLPWNPTRLEQRKGRIQRIGQEREVVLVYNMRYLGSVEDRVHHLLSGRLKAIYQLFGQLPDVLEDVWVSVALGNIERAKSTIDGVPEQHPFEIRYQTIENINWESCARVLNQSSRMTKLLNGWL